MHIYKLNLGSILFSKRIVKIFMTPRKIITFQQNVVPHTQYITRMKTGPQLSPVLSEVYSCYFFF